MTTIKQQTLQAIQKEKTPFVVGELSFPSFSVVMICFSNKIYVSI